MNNAYVDYLKMTMNNLATIVYNTSQGNQEWNSKDAILDSLIRIVEDYKRASGENIEINDFRKRL